MKILVTGGTTFVSRFTASYFALRGYEVYVLNRGSKEQVEGVTLIKGDRHDLGSLLKDTDFDAVLDITGYTGVDVNDLLDGLSSFGKYIFVSSSAVYPETEKQPFAEESKLAVNKFWGKYGTDKIEAEKTLLTRVPDAYILRPPYLYGPMNNLYREAFVYDCADKGRKFYLPGDGSMKLHFFHVEDLCRLMEIIIKEFPDEHILNVGNPEAVTVKQWVEDCYDCFGKEPEFINVTDDIEQRKYFSFYNYEYFLDVTKMLKIMPDTKDFKDGLRESARWYKDNSGDVRKKPFFEFIDTELGGKKVSSVTYNFEGKNYVVTGSASGMGECCCQMLIAAGARVFGIDRSEASIDSDKYSHYQIDITDEQKVIDTVNDILAKCGRIDGLVNAAGIFANNKPFYELTSEEWNRVLGINLTGTFLMSKYVSDSMMKNESGKIVNISCIRSSIFKEKMADYAASKGGVSAFTSAMALDLAPYNINVNAVAPGFIRTGMTAASFDNPEIAAASEKLIPAGRIGMPDDIANVVMFLLSDASNYMTGTTVFADGGYRAKK